MKNTVILIFIIILFFSCVEKNDTANTPHSTANNSIMGSWKLVYADIRENDSIQIKDLSNTDFIKIINATHFAFFNQERGSSENYFAGGGTYVLDGTTYTETLDFINDTDFRGHEFPFNIEIKGDSLIQKGHEKVEAAGVDRYILEKYIRINTQH